MKNLICFFAIIILLKTGTADTPQIIKLDPPAFKNNISLMEALQKRQSNRDFKKDEIPLAQLGNLLWAAYGINRAESGKRTAPSTYNLQYVDIYVALKNGFYLYDAKEHQLILKLNEDVRELTGLQDFVKDAPLNLVYVGDQSKLKEKIDKEDFDFYFGVLGGSICQNVYLYCASENLFSVARGSVPRDELTEKIGLEPFKKVLFAQTVGLPGE